MGAEIKVLIQQVDISEQHARSSVSARARRAGRFLPPKYKAYAIIQVRRVALPPHGGAENPERRNHGRRMHARVQQLRRVRMQRPHRPGPQHHLETNSRSNIKHVIGVVSGKGGVGKSLVTSLLASEMQKRGKNVGILDADVTGPSIPKTFGITNPLTADADGILPGQTQSGIKVMSTNLMLPKTTSRWPGAARSSRTPSVSSTARRTGARSTTCSSTCLREPPTCCSPCPVAAG